MKVIFLIPLVLVTLCLLSVVLQRTYAHYRFSVDEKKTQERLYRILHGDIDLMLAVIAQQELFKGAPEFKGLPDEVKELLLSNLAYNAVAQSGDHWSKEESEEFVFAFSINDVLKETAIEAIKRADYKEKEK